MFLLSCLLNDQRRRFFPQVVFVPHDDKDGRQAICRTLHPATWNPDVGLCKIEAVGGGAGLKIKQTYRVHRDIERLLADLRMVGRR